jgi:hypothetical protein
MERHRKSGEPFQGSNKKTANAMKTEQLLVLQFIAHLLTDYTFQPPLKALEKNEYGFRSRFLKWHILLAFLLSWVLSFQWLFVCGALVISLIHWLIDGMKIHLNRSRRFGKYAFFIDQGMHLVIITVVVLLYQRWFYTDPIFYIPTYTPIPALIACFLFCSKPANILIKELLGVFDIRVRKTGTEETDLPNAGKLIGIVERWLIVVFILISQFEAIGFLLAAKSIMRFKSDESLKTEYLLTGTLLSFAIAIGAGLLVSHLFL